MKRKLGRCVNGSTPSSAKIKYVELYLHSPYITFTLPLPNLELTVSPKGGLCFMELVTECV